MKKDILKLAKTLVESLENKKLTVATAESCTGGLLSSYITAVSGSSAVFELGISSYSVRIKNKILSVGQNTLDQKGAISKETATEMAQNVLIMANADIALSITGVAGPNTSEGHNVGLVYIAVATKEGVKVIELNAAPKNRQYVRETAVLKALDLGIRTVTEKF